MEPNKLIEAWRNTIVGAHKSWVVFENGTCVIVVKPAPDLERQATTLLRKWGPVHVGSPAGDFSTVTLDNGVGWVVTCHHNDILTLVLLNEIDEGASDLEIGLFGRSKRAKDASDLRVVHVDDNRCS